MYVQIVVHDFVFLIYFYIHSICLEFDTGIFAYV